MFVVAAILAGFIVRTEPKGCALRRYVRVSYLPQDAAVMAVAARCRR